MKYCSLSKPFSLIIIIIKSEIKILQELTMCNIDQIKPFFSKEIKPTASGFWKEIMEAH